MTWYSKYSQKENQQLGVGAGDFPSGECFRNVIFYASKHCDNSFEIVHGLVRKFQGGMIDHAWIERGDEVLDPTLNMRTTKAKYYRIMEAKPSSRYPALRTVGRAYQSGHYGPWDQNGQ